MQELLQSRRLALPDYQVVNIKGHAHSQVFYVKCIIRQMNIEVKGEGKSRRKAEQRAAKKAIIEVKSSFEKKQSE